MVRKVIINIVFLSGFVIAGCGPKAFLVRPVPLQQDLQEREIERDKGRFVADKVAVIDLDGVMVTWQKWGLLREGEIPESLFV